MSKITDYNFVSMVKQTLERELRDRIFSEIMKDVIVEFASNAEPIVKEAVERVSIEAVDHMHDLSRIRDELSIRVRWIDEETKS